jgi:hypothetical protein
MTRTGADSRVGFPMCDSGLLVRRGSRRGRPSVAPPARSRGGWVERLQPRRWRAGGLPRCGERCTGTVYRGGCPPRSFSDGGWNVSAQAKKLQGRHAPKKVRSYPVQGWRRHAPVNGVSRLLGSGLGAASRCRVASGSGRDHAVASTTRERIRARGLGAWLSFRREMVPGTAPIAILGAQTRIRTRTLQGRGSGRRRRRGSSRDRDRDRDRDRERERERTRTRTRFTVGGSVRTIPLPAGEVLEWLNRAAC